MQTRLVYVGGPKNGFTEVMSLPLNTAQIGVLAIGAPCEDDRKKVTHSDTRYYLHDVYFSDKLRMCIAYASSIELKDALEQFFEAFILLNGTNK